MKTRQVTIEELKKIILEEVALLRVEDVLNEASKPAKEKSIIDENVEAQSGKADDTLDENVQLNRWRVLAGI